MEQKTGVFYISFPSPYRTDCMYFSFSDKQARADSFRVKGCIAHIVL